MNSFDELVNGAKKCFDVAVEKTGEAVEASRRQIEKSQLTCKLRDEYAALGRLCYDMTETGKNCADNMRQRIINIRSLKEQLGTLTEEQGIHKESDVCPVCGKAVKKSFAYCPKCGAKR